MEHPFSSFLFLCGLSATTIPGASFAAGTCPLLGGAPQSAKSVQFNSDSFDAGLIGFGEFMNVSNPPRRYRTRTVKGDNTYHIFATNDCSSAIVGDYAGVYDLTCQYDARTGAFSSVDNSYLDYFLNPGPQRIYASCSEILGTITSPTTAENVLGDGTCEPNRWVFGLSDYRAVSATGTVTTALTDEDTEDDAKARAVKMKGSSSTAYRTTRTGLGFSECDVHFKATFIVDCPGDYDVHLGYSIKPHGAAGPVTTETVITRRRLESGERIVEGDVKVDRKDTDYTLVSVTLEKPDCGDRPPGHPEITVHSVRGGFSLGRASSGLNAGELRLDAETITAALYAPAALTAVTAGAGSVEIVRDPGGALRQLKAPQTFADIVTLDASSYEVRFYTPADMGLPDAATKIYAVSGTPFVTYKFANPDFSGATRLRITETRGSIVRVNEYSYDSAASTLMLSSGNGLRREALAIAVAGTDTTKTTTIRDGGNAVVSKSSKTYHAYPWGEELVQEVLDPDGAALTTSYVFYSDTVNDGGAYGHLKQRTNADSSWERRTYDSTGQPLKTIRPFLNASATAAESLCRVTENSYSTLPDADGDGTVEQLTTTVESTLGQETGRSYRLDWSKPVPLGPDACNRRTDIHCVTAGAARTDAANLVTETLIYTADPYIGRTRRVINPDGTATLTSYSVDASGQQTGIAKTGAPNATQDDIVSGTRTTTFTSAQGQVTGESITDIASTNLLTSWAATQFDTLGRPTRFDYTDGTYATRDYTCCGLSSSRDRAGITTTYLYDDLGREATVTSNGLTTHTTYDADSRVKAVSRIGSDNNTMLQSSLTYDFAGRLTESRDALNRLTATNEVFDAPTGQTTRTTTTPSGTSVEVRARDGSPLSVSGTAAAPRSYDYGVDADGLYTKQTLIGDSGSTTEWTKSYTDFAGRSYKTVYADNASAQSYFSTVGQFVRQVDPDGITTLFAYNARGEQETTALDVNANGLIDFDGIDRITKTTSIVATKTVAATTYTVQRTTTQVWETDGQNTPTTVSISEQSPDGLHSWQTLRGLSSNTVTTLDGAGGRSVTSTGPDGVKNIQVYAGGQLASATVKTAADVQLAAAIYGYDPHHRLQSITDARAGTTTYSYNADDQIHTVITADPDISRSDDGYDPQTTTYAYDATGRVATVTQPDGGVVNTTYYPTGAVKRTWGSRTYLTEYSYDLQGRVQTLTTWQDVAGNAGKAITAWNYSPDRGLLLNKRYADNTGPSYTYWPSGRLHTRTWARGLVTTYVYSAGGDLGSIGYSDATPAVSLSYDRSGRPQTTADAAGTRTLSYDASGHLKDEDYTAGLLNTLGVHRTFDSLTRLANVSVFSASSAFNPVAYSYDAASRLDTVTAGTNTATYGYVPNSSLVQTITFAQGGTSRLTTTKSYDNLNRLSSTSNTPSASSAVSVDYDYNAANQRTKATREDNAHWNYGYDALGQVTTGQKFDASDGGLPGSDFAWTYDDIGNRKTATTNSQISRFTPNILNEYSIRSVPGSVDVTGAAAASATVTVALNNGAPQATARGGELFFKQLTVDNGSAAQNPAIEITGVKNGVGANGEDAVTEVTKAAFVPQSPERFTHDADGNLTDDARWHYTWDAENRLIAMETATGAYAPIGPLPATASRKLEFAYDAQGRRVSRNVYSWTGNAWLLARSTHFLYDGWNLLADLNALNSNAVVCTYAWGLDLSGSLQGAGGVGGLLLSTLSSQLSTHAAAYDGNGNAIGLVDMATGIKSATYDYNAFGETIQSDGVAAVSNHFRFSTKYTDDETGQLYYGFRYYNPSTGRWLSRDPLEEEGGVNLYGFVGNDPVSNVDVLGLAGFFFDGTGNLERDRTNVSILRDVYDGFARYYPGVGSSFGTRALGGLTGAGGSNRLEAAYRDFIRAVDSGDRYVDIVGFSRGAALAREFANLLNERGYDPSYGGNLKYKLRAGTSKPPGECEFVIRFVGLFDTVGSFGVPGNNTNIGIRVDLPGAVGNAAQATAQNERRLLFPLTPLGDREGFGEQGFPGDHSDIGRGHRQDNNDLSRAPLEYIWSQGKAAGVPFRNLPQYTPTGNTTPHDLSRKFPHNLFPKRPR